MLITCFFFLLLFQLHQTFALTFASIIGPFVTGAQVPVSWTLDGTEPANGFQLWFSATGSSIKLADIAPGVTSAVVIFPGNGDGVFQAFSGTFLLATSNEVDIAVTTVFSATSTSSTPVFSTSSSSSLSSVTSSTPTSSAAAESNSTTKSSAMTTEALLGIIVGTLAVIAIIVVASVALFIRRRRRSAADGANAYPFEPQDVEKQLAQQITPFDPQARLVPPPPPPRGSSLRRPPTSSSTTVPSSRRQEYLNSQLQRLDIAPDSGVAISEKGSIVFGPLSSVPSDVTPVSQPFEMTDPTERSLPLPPILEDASGSRRAAYLANQLARLERRPSNGASVLLSPLSTVPSESTGRRPSDGSAVVSPVSSEGTARPYAPSISTTVNSPIQFVGSNSPIQLSRRARFSSMLDPVATRVAPR
ncbi:hypothetical protein B0H16DRAFT_1569627 [Mycena metata]|uniref:Uncharacterized protein n=1 Tax=Mycena metata TaxID=1033252 RepID=A0AAD7IAH2_9AGAR|nr:hypothetical protein B0H16DRAFT_1569627 [Mycena metata]